MLRILLMLAATITTVAQAKGVDHSAARPPSTPNARIALAAYGACIADRSPQIAGEHIHLFESQTFVRVIDAFGKSNDECRDSLGKGSEIPFRMRGNATLFAGAIAERLLANDSQPLKNRFAHIAAQAPIQTKSPILGVAVCALRSDPDNAAAFLSSEIASEEEQANFTRLRPVGHLCSRGKLSEVNVEGFRAVIAVAAFLSSPAKKMTADKR